MRKTGVRLMARKKKKRFVVTKVVKAMARETIGSPPPTKRAPDRKKQALTQEKHKPTLGEMLREE